MRRAILCLTIAITCAFSLNARQQADKVALERCRQQVEELDGPALYKLYVCNLMALGNGNREALIGDIPSSAHLWMYMGYSIELYYDEHYRLRKSLRRVSDSDYLQNTILYFDENGYLIHKLEHLDDAGYVYHLKAYTNRNRIIWGELYTHYDSLEYRMFVNEPLPYHISRSEHRIPSTFHTDSIRLYGSNTAISPLQRLPLGAKQVRFSTPQKGQTCYINAGSVNMRTQPSSTSEIAAPYKLYFGDELEVLEVAAVEKISKHTNRWYKVAYMSDWTMEGGRIGYVYGAYLTPGEQALPDSPKPDVQRITDSKNVFGNVLNDTLRVGFIAIAKEGDTTALLGSVPKGEHWLKYSSTYTLYFDKNNNIRRLKQHSIDMDWLNDCYYDEQGVLRYALFYEHGHGIPAVSGYMCADKDGAAMVSIHNRWNSDSIYMHYEYYNVAIPNEYVGYDFGFYTSTDSLKKAFSIHHISPDSKQVCFVRPQVGDTITVYQEQLSIYGAPGTLSPIIETGYVDNRYTISAIINEDKPIHERWYEIDVIYHYSDEEKKYVFDKGYAKASNLLFVEKELP